MENVILSILQEIRPESDFSDSINFVSDGLLDSFDMVMLVDELESNFSISIDGTSVIPENFESLSSIVRLVETSKKTS